MYNKCRDIQKIFWMQAAYIVVHAEHPENYLGVYHIWAGVNAVKRISMLWQLVYNQAICRCDDQYSFESRKVLGNAGE